MATATTLPSFSDLVVNAIVAHSNFHPEQLIVPDNSSKYNPQDVRQNNGNDESLTEIFKLMAKLNRGALQTFDLCAGQHGPSFRDALHLVTGKLAMLIGDRQIRFVELGPEPWKSKAILAGLIAANVQISQYIGIDINPESEETMRESLTPIIGAHRFSYCIQDFYTVSAAELPMCDGENKSLDNCVTVVANLGFQEGNDLPSRIGLMLSRLTQPGDLLLSEMQVLQARENNGSLDSECIEHFYHLPEMRRFSEIVGNSFQSESSSSVDASQLAKDRTEHHFILAPLETNIGPVNVATTLVATQSEGVKKYVVTNSCLKFTPVQFRSARESTGHFLVKEVQTTGDASIVFQISERC